SRYGMDPFAAAVQPLLVQHGVHLWRQRRLPSLGLTPGGAKCFCSRAAAEEARAMPGGERHRFVEKEKLGPAGAAHHLPVPPLVDENKNEPRLGRPAPPEQRFGCRVVDDPAVADEKASLRNRDDIAKRGHPVLQGSPTAAHRPLAAIGKTAAHVDRQFAIRYQAFDSPREIRRVGGRLRSETQRQFLRAGTPVLRRLRYDLLGGT